MMNHDSILGAFESSVRAALAEMLPGVGAELRQGAPPSSEIGDAAIVALSGDLCGSVIVLTPRDSTKVLARRIAGGLIEKDDGQMAANGFLTLLEQDSLRELANRVGCIIAGELSTAEQSLNPTFPVFVCGQDINVVADSDYNSRLAFVLEGSIRLEARLFLSAPRPSANRAEQIRELERIREVLLADEKA